MLPELRMPLGPWLIVISTHASAVAAAMLLGTVVAARRAPRRAGFVAWLPLLALAALAGIEAGAPQGAVWVPGTD